MKRRKIVCCLIAVLVVAAGVFGAYRYARVNDVKYRADTEYYPTGEFVSIGENYFDGSQENPTGYSIRVDGATVRSYSDYLESLGGKVRTEDYESIGAEIPKYVYDVQVTIRNENREKTDGYIFFGRYELQDKSLCLVLDYEVWNRTAPHAAEAMALTLVPESEEVLHFPFVQQPNAGLTAPKQANRMIENDPFYLCVSFYPVRKLIRVDNVTFE